MCRRLVIPALAAATLLCTASARADGLAIHADGFAGYSNYSKAGPGLTLGADALLRVTVFQAGLLVDSTAGAGNAGNGNETAQTYAAMAGLAFYGQRFGLDLLAVGGAHVYDHVSQSLDTSGVNAVEPFLQARVGFNLLMFRPLTLGLWGFAGDDLSRGTKTFSVPNDAPGGGQTNDTASVGETSWGFAFRIGVDCGI
jgi:hypothetical protein